MRILLLIPPAVSLILGLSIGLVRFGWEVPLPDYDLLIAHGALMVCGFFGSLICLERSVVIGRPIAFVVPLLCGIGVATQIYVPVHGAGSTFFLLSAMGLVVTYLCLPGRRDAGFAVQLAGAAAWVIGTGTLVAELPSFVQVPWWTGFLVLTIAGERLELSRFRNPSTAARSVFLTLVALYLAGAAGTLAGFLVDRAAEIRDTDLGEQFGSTVWHFGQAAMGIG